MKNDLFSIGSFTIHSYGLMIAIGILVAYVVSMYTAKRLYIKSSHIDSLMLWCLLGGFLGAKCLYWLTRFNDILHEPSLLLDVSDGYVVFGGIIGGIWAGYLYCKKKDICFLQYFDLLVPSIALAQSIGRIGCFFAGCCYGMETESIFGVVFPPNSLAPDGVRLIPTQLISSGLDFIHFIILILLAKNKKFDGQIAAAYLILYSMGRFVLEFFRGDLARGSVGALSTSQFISVGIFIFGVCMLFKVSIINISAKKRNQRNE